jgi:hypothetical protein
MSEVHMIKRLMFLTAVLLVPCFILAEGDKKAGGDAAGGKAEGKKEKAAPAVIITGTIEKVDMKDKGTVEITVKVDGKKENDVITFGKDFKDYTCDGKVLKNPSGLVSGAAIKYSKTGKKVAKVFAGDDAKKEQPKEQPKSKEAPKGDKK